ncbi:MAG: hypothetical protein ICV60_09675 [Pyrinomonadaceae bacterium]|nr:hypothetical protein [Pyrinomonadaceae bacterium]
MDALESHELTELLVAWSDGDEAALDRLAPLVQAELRRLASHYMRQERSDHLLPRHGDARVAQSEGLTL